MDIKAKTIKDKLYDLRVPILFVTVVALILLVSAFNRMYDNNERKAQQKLEAFKQAEKVKKIKADKPTLVCNGTTVLTPTDYDLTILGDVSYIVTDENMNFPKASLEINHCEIFNKITNGIIIKPKVVVPIDVKHAEEIDKLHTELKVSSSENAFLTTENKLYKENLEQSNKDIKALKTFIGNQDKELDRLLLVEARYNEINGLLEIVLEKKSLTVKDLMVKPIKPKVKKVAIKKHIEKIKPKKVEVVKVIPKDVNIANKSEHLQRILYTIRFLSTGMRDNPKQHIVPVPTAEDLNRFRVSDGQIKTFEQIKSQLMKVIERLSVSQTKNLNITNNALRNSIRQNVGLVLQEPINKPWLVSNDR